MKRCPECRRDYYDDTLSFCLEDGRQLVQGSVSAVQVSGDEPATAILHTTDADGDAPTQHKEPESPVSPGDPAERQSLSAGRTAKPLVICCVVISVLISGFLGYKHLSPTKRIESIAVMPFINDSGNTDFDYLSDGLTETIIKNLSQLASLRVRPRSSVFRYKGLEADSKAIGRELQVQALLSGRVVQRGQDLSLFVELIDIASDKVVWSEQYTRKQSDLVSLEHEVARDITKNLSLKLSGAEEQKLVKTYTSNPEAYQLYLRGRHEWNKFSLEGLTKSILFFERAIDVDPNYALAYSGIADSHINLGVDFLSPIEHMPKARAAALRAVALDDSLAEAHTSLASYKLFFEWDAYGAEEDFRKAITLDPNYADARHFYSHCLQFTGREADALLEMKTAVDLEPLSALNNAELGWAYYLARKYDEAIEQSKKTLELEPGFAYGYFVLGLAYNGKGMYAEARSSFEKGLSFAPDWLEMRGLLASSHAAAGDGKQARDILTKVLEASRTGYMNEVVVASAFVALDDHDQAIAWLERGYRERCSWMKWIWIEPMLDKLRPDPRFQDLLRRIGR